MKNRKRVKQVLHEVVAGRHRIVIVSADQTVTGQWAELHQLAVLNELLANAQGSSQLPKGVFKVSSVAQQVLA